MKKLLIVLITASLIACKPDDKKQDSVKSVDENKEVATIDRSAYPENLFKVFEVHGGLQAWKEMKSLTYSIPQEEDKEEVHTTDLQSRDILIESENWQIGSQAGKVWLAQDSTYYPKERARFYHNLIFYFYAMPFILSDDGINYSEAPALQKDGVTYPAVRITYENNVGDSPDDEYIVYYDPNTYQMEWLAYTVTYFSKEKAAQKPVHHWLRYTDWQEVNGLILPQSMQFYDYEDGKPTVGREEGAFAKVNFNKADVDRAEMDNDMFSMPENGEYVD